MSSFLPKVTVFLASYNQEAYICEAYESVLNQDYPNIEIVGFDNGSVDATRKIIESKYAKLPNVKFFYHTKNESNQRAVIEGIQHITGDFLCHLHGDDFYLPNKVRLQVECFEKLLKVPASF